MVKLAKILGALGLLVTITGIEYAIWTASKATLGGQLLLTGFVIVMVAVIIGFIADVTGGRLL